MLVTYHHLKSVSEGESRCIIPTYDYKCKACGHELEAFHAMSAQLLKDCPECHKPELVKLIGAGAAVIVRGTETPCRGSRGGKTHKKQHRTPNITDKLGQGKNKTEKPFWRDGEVNKKVLKDPEKYIKRGEVD